MKYIIISFLPILLFGAFLACQPSTESQKWGGECQLYQVNGCQGGELSKAAIGDSSFTYQFDSDLILDFRVSANCCPDSNRFTLQQAIQNDSITITVLDTAANLCFCDCSYIIHAEFYDMPEDMYYVDVLAGDGQLLHREEVWRIF
jgi:hypothetical protein